MSEAFRSLLSRLASELSLPDIPVQEGAALIVVDDFEVGIRLLPSEQVMMYTVLAPLPAERHTLMTDLLAANTLFIETHGFTLSAREDTGVMLQGLMPMCALHSGNIGQWLQNFVDLAEHWQARCLQSSSAPASADPLVGEGAFDPLTMMDMLRI